MFEFAKENTDGRSSTKKSPTYEEIRFGKEYVTVHEGKVTYQRTLTEKQEQLRRNGGWMNVRVGAGGYGAVQNPSLYPPLELHSVGNGPAVNVSVRLKGASLPLARPISLRWTPLFTKRSSFLTSRDIDEILS